ncbi:hypothetical protein BUALT_Bualt17G0111200 [Buddleja alternifolia]|uniref:Pectinesterase catalytic domain-containing protein n=1 Tax=Buddleja alternifolia TaxID=168488 RepID=A0AAV6W9K0_9LAMI|nr:hypothetical protein BUALT_Bualt17G0111200 [Buddleja alternifolia]
MEFQQIAKPFGSDGKGLKRCSVGRRLIIAPTECAADLQVSAPFLVSGRRCTIDGLIDPAGWLPWSGNFALSTLYYGEYMNTGLGANTIRRVKWPGFHVITSVTEAGKFTVRNFLAGDSWIQATHVPFTSGL